MKIFILVITSAIILFAFSAALGVAITGIVVDINGEILPGTQITIKNSGTKTISDKSGEFTIEMPGSISSTLVFILPGYKVLEVAISSEHLISPLKIELALEIFRLDEVIVSASRKKESSFEQSRFVNVISQRDIKYQQSATTADILKRQTEIELQKTSHSGGSPIIRGLFGKRILILTDGIRLNNSSFRAGTNPYINTIPTGAIQSVEVMGGYSSVLFGSDALGGIINIITIPSTTSAEFTVLRSSYSTTDEGLVLGYNSYMNLKKGIAAFNLERRNIGDLKGGGDVGRQSPSGWKDISGNGCLSYPLNERFIFSSGIQLYRVEDIPRYDRYLEGKYKQYLYDPRTRFLGYIRLSDNRGHLGLNDVDYTVSFQKQLEGRRYRKSGSEKTTLQEVNVNTFQSSIIGEKTFSNSFGMTIGTEFYYDIIDSWRENHYQDSIIIDTPPLPDGAYYSSFGIFTNYEWDIDRKWKIRPGLRFSYFKTSFNPGEPYSHFDDSYADITFSIGALYKLRSSINMVLNLNRGFRAPNLDDLSKLEISAAGREIPSFNLKPENSYQVDWGLKWNSKKAKGEFGLWGSVLTDFINRSSGFYCGLNFWDENGNGIRDTDEDIILVKKNSDKFYMTGIQFSNDIALNDNWSILTSLSFNYGKNADTDEPMSKIPPLKTLFSLSYSDGVFEKVELYAVLSGKQDRLSDLDKLDSRINPSGTPAWATLNLKAKFEPYNKINFSFTLENLFNKAYKQHASGIYSPGFNVISSAEIQL